jgi:hypothetical protein
MTILRIVFWASLLIAVIVAPFYVWRPVVARNAMGSGPNGGGLKSNENTLSKPRQATLFVSIVISLGTLAYPFYPFLEIFSERLALPHALFFVLFLGLPIIQLINTFCLARWRRRDIKENNLSASRLVFALRLAAIAVLVPPACLLYLFYEISRSGFFPTPN